MAWQYFTTSWLRPPPKLFRQGSDSDLARRGRECVTVRLGPCVSERTEDSLRNSVRGGDDQCQEEKPADWQLETWNGRVCSLLFVCLSSRLTLVATATTGKRTDALCTTCPVLSVPQDQFLVRQCVRALILFCNLGPSSSTTEHHGFLCLMWRPSRFRICFCCARAVLAFFWRTALCSVRVLYSTLR